MLLQMFKLCLYVARISVIQLVGLCLQLCTLHVYVLIKCNNMCLDYFLYLYVAGKCNNTCLDYNENYLSWQPGGIGRMVTFLFLQGIFYFSLLILFESRVWQSIRYFIQYIRLRLTRRPRHWNTSDNVQEGEDDDVASERCHVLANRDTLPSSCAISLINVSKFYGSHLAVDRACLAIEKNECFGLLGVNGAGKTTTFKMLLGDEMITEGNAYLMKRSIKYGSRGVCNIINVMEYFRIDLIVLSYYILVLL